MVELVNTYLGQYYLTEVIGRGSTSTVYKAFQSSLNRYVAVKVLTNDLDPHSAARFTREAHAVAQLQHPNILPIYDYGEQGTTRYFVMQYVEGSGTLAEMLGGRPMEPIAALRLILPLLSALAYAHARGVIHRDVKPANIMMPRPDWPMLADFGIAKLVDDSQQLTPPGQSVGTAIYMAPERATSSKVDLRTDLYSISVVLYEMLTGQVPFDGVTPVDVLRKHMHSPPPPPRSLNPRLPDVVEPVLMRALAKAPIDRYQSAEELAQALQRLIGQIERLQAQIQLQQMLGATPAPTDAAAAPNPYATHPLPSEAPTQPYVRPPAAAQPPRAAAQPGGWLRLGVPLAIVLLILGGLALARQARGFAGDDPPLAAATIAALPTTTPFSEAIAPTAEATAPLATALAVASTIVPTSAPTEAARAPIDTPTETAPAPTIAAAPAPPEAAASTPQTSQRDDATTVRLEDSDWQGGYRRAAGRTYGGRTATWVYGSSTPYNVMQASFAIATQPRGTATLTIEGMDSEDRIKTPISIQVNGVEIFSGDNPLPDDDHPLETGTWASYAWSFDAALLQPGQNVISITNLAPGAFSLPPFFMLDYADVAYTTL